MKKLTDATYNLIRAPFNLSYEGNYWMQGSMSFVEGI